MTDTAVGAPSTGAPLPSQQPIQPQVIEGPPPVRKSYAAAKHGKASTIMEVEIDGTVFETRPGRVPGTVQIDFMGVSTLADPRLMWNFFRCAFVDIHGNAEPEKYKAFKKFLDDPIREVDVDTLIQIIRDMIEFANGLPTVPSSS